MAAMRVLVLCLAVLAAARAERRLPRVIYVNLKVEEMEAMQGLLLEETGSAWRGTSVSQGRWRLALLDQVDLDWLGVDGASVVAALTASWSRGRKRLEPLIITSWNWPVDAEVLRGSAEGVTPEMAAELASVFDDAGAFFVDHFGLRAPVDVGSGGSGGSGGGSGGASGGGGAALCGSTADGGEVLVLDGFVDDDLRAGLLGLLHGDGVDPEVGVDEALWARGAVADGDPGPETEAGGGEGHWGLRPEALLALCQTPPEGPTPPAVAELQRVLLGLVARANPGGGVLARLSYQLSPPGADFGVSPCVANAVAGGAGGSGIRYDFHRDADPSSLPPSAWTDAFGHYPNRAPGMPRFVTALVYLNRAWKDDWRGATRLRVGPRKRPKKARSGRKYVDVAPKPGRLLLMDQDIAHAITHSNGTAVPRYSLALKLVLHPPDDDPARGVAYDPARRVELIDVARFGLPARLDRGDAAAEL